MKKKFLKGFTLIELIVVMAILSILMAAVINFMRPIRRTYIDSTLYESQRNTQNGISKYLTNSTRFATNLGVYQKGERASYDVYGDTNCHVSRSVNNVSDAVNFFLDDASGYTAASKSGDSTAIAVTSRIRKELINKVQVIVIDNANEYEFSNGKFKGRLLKSKDVDAITNDMENPDTDSCRLALGSAYYGDSDYSIHIDPVTGVGLKYTVTSRPSVNLMPNVSVSTESEINCANLFTTTGVMYAFGYKMVRQISPAPFSQADLDKVVFPGNIFDTNLYGGSSEDDGAVTYIVFLTPNDLETVG